jgi:hypothetical protein
MSAAGAYNRTLGLYGKSLDPVQVSQLQKAEADCYFEAAFQSENRTEFKRRMKLSQEAYETASSLYSGSGRLGISDLLKCRALFSTYWLTDEAAERASIMAQILPMAEKATKRLEEDGDDYLAESLRKCLQFYFEGLGLATKSGETKARFEQAAELVEKAVAKTEEMKDDPLLLEVLGTAILILVVLNSATDPERYKIHANRALELASKVTEVSSRIRTPRAIAVGCLATGIITSYLKSDPITALSYAETGLREAQTTKDSFLVGFLAGLGSFVSGLAGMMEEDIDKKRELFQKSLALIRTAIGNLEIPRQGAILGWTWYWYGDCQTIMATNAETAVDAKKDLLTGAAATAERGIEYETFGAPFSGPELALAKALYFSALIESDPKKKADLLLHALRSSEREVKRRSIRYPNSWDLGIAFYYLAMTRSQISEACSEQDKVEYLQGAIADMEKCVKFCGEWGPMMGRTHILARCEESYGDILSQLHRVVKEESIAEEAAQAYGTAVNHLTQTGLVGASSSVQWKLAQTYDRIGDFERASSAFMVAAEICRKAAKKLLKLSGYFEDLAFYMEAWACIEDSRFQHRKERYSAAAGNYAKASSILGTTRNWNYLAGHYAACSLLEEGEALSRRERQEDSIERFHRAAETFENARARLAIRAENTLEEREKSELNDWLKVTNGRLRYSRAMADLEEARLLDRRGKNEASLVKYRSASKSFTELLGPPTKRAGKSELETMTLFCKACERMKEAEIKGSYPLYNEASRLFLQAEKTAPDQRFRPLAIANSSICRALALGTRFKRSKKAQLYSKIKTLLETAGDAYEGAGFDRAAAWTRATQKFFDALAYYSDASAERDAEKKGTLYRLAEKQFESASRLYARAGFLGREAEARRLFQRAKEERNILSPLQALGDQLIALQRSTPASLLKDKPLGLERLESTHIIGTVKVLEPKSILGSATCVEFELTNLGKLAATLISVEGFAPTEFQIDEERSPYPVHEGSLDLRGKRLDQLKTHGFKIFMTARQTGLFELKPRVVFADDKGRQGLAQLGPVIIAVQESAKENSRRAPRVSADRVPPAPESWFETGRARGVFQHLATVFLRDYLSQGLFADKAGWRSLMDLVRELGIPRSAFYGPGGHDGAVIAELEKRDLVERKIFPNERGRGGAITKIRVAYENPPVRTLVKQALVESL